MSEQERPAGTDGDGASRAERDGPSLLHRAGVIGADAIHPGDPGNPFIPTPPGGSAAVGPETAAVDAWTESKIPDGEVEDWQRVGATPTTAATLRRLGAGPEDVEAAPVSADELVGWLWHGFAVEEVGEWLAHGSVRIAARRRAAGLPPEGAPS